MILETFHPLHLSLLAVTVLLPFALHFLFRKKSEVWKTNFLIVLCAVNLLIFFVYKAFLSVDAEFLRIDGAERFNWLNELPIQLCNINLFLIPIGLLTKKRFLLGFSFIIAPLGAMMALLFPEPAFHGFSLLVPRILGFYLTHALIFVCGMWPGNAGLLSAGGAGFSGNCRFLFCDFRRGASCEPAFTCNGIVRSRQLFLYLWRGYQHSESFLAVDSVPVFLRIAVSCDPAFLYGACVRRILAAGQAQSTQIRCRQHSCIRKYRFERREDRLCGK